MKHIKKKFRYEDCDFFEELKTSKKTSSINIDTRFDRRVLKDS
jgi:hypothetical protein